MLLQAIAKTYDLSIVRARSTVRAAIFNFLFVAGVTGLKSATNALYLARRDPSDLPYLYFGTAITVAVVTAWYGKRLGVMSAKHVLRRSLIGWSVALVLFGGFAAADFRSALGLLYVAAEAYATSLSVLYWARLGEVFDIRAQKRVFGLIAAVGMGGAVAGGVFVTVLVHFDVPAVAWCFITPILTLSARPLLGKGITPGSIRRERITLADGLSYATGHKFPLAVAALVLMFAVHAASIDYVFRTGTHRFEGGNEGSMAVMFGVLNAVVGVLSIAFQSALTARLLKRVGVFTYLSIVPGLSMIAALWALVMPTVFVPLFIMKVLEMMGSYSLNQTGLQLLYNPMPTAVRGSVRAVIDGAVKKLGGAVGGVVLLVVGSLMSTTDLIGVVVGLGGVLLLWISLLRPRYLEALQQKLGDRGVGPIPVIDPHERSTRQQLIKALGDDDVGTTLSSIAVLQTDATFDFHEHIHTLVSHPAEAVRLKAIELIQRSPSDDYVPFLVSVVTSTSTHPKAQAARALVMIDPVTARRVLEPVLRSDQTSDRALVSAAIAALLGADRDDEGAGGVADLARSALERMLESVTERTSSERRELVRLLGLLGPGPYAHHIGPFLDDSNDPVRFAAIEAAGLTQERELVPALMALLGDRKAKRFARTALADYGDAIVAQLASFLDDRRNEVSARVQVPAILRMIGTKDAANAMLFSNRHDDAYLRYVIIEELGRMHRRDPDLAFDRDQTKGAALRRLRAYTHYRPFASDLDRAGPDFQLLARAVNDRVRQNLQAGLRVLGLLYDPKAMANASFGLLGGSGSLHADAVEQFDVALDGADVRGEVLRHIEPTSPRGRDDRALERARALVEGRDIQLATIAAETLRRLGDDPPSVREPTSGEPLMPQSIVERVFLLQNVQFFHTLSVDDLAAVASICTKGHAEARQVIYEEGELGDALYVIISGGIRLHHGGELLMELHAGDSFGQTSVLDGGSRPVTAKAADEGVDFMRLERQPLLDLMADRPELVSGLLAELGKRIRELIELTQARGQTSPIQSGTGSTRPATSS